MHLYRQIVVSMLALMFAVSASYADNRKSKKTPQQSIQVIQQANAALNRVDGDVLVLHRYQKTAYPSAFDFSIIDSNRASLLFQMKIDADAISSIEHDACLKAIALESLDDSNKIYSPVKKILECEECEMTTITNAVRRRVEQIDCGLTSIDCARIGTAFPDIEISMQSATMPSVPYLDQMKASSFSMMLPRQLDSIDYNAQKAVTDIKSQTDSLLAKPTLDYAPQAYSSAIDVDNSHAVCRILDMSSSLRHFNAAHQLPKQTESSIESRDGEFYTAVFSSDLVKNVDASMSMRQHIDDGCLEKYRLPSISAAHTQPTVQKVSEYDILVDRNVDWFSSLQQMYLRLQYLKSTGKSTRRLLDAIDRQLVKEHDKNEAMRTNRYFAIWHVKSRTIDVSGRTIEVVGFDHALDLVDNELKTTVSQRSGIDFNEKRRHHIVSSLAKKMKDDVELKVEYYIYTIDATCTLTVEKAF